MGSVPARGVGIRLAPRELLVVAGLPGAGKSTALRSLTSSVPVTVLDSEGVYRVLSAWSGLPYRVLRCVVHPVHYVRTVLCCVRVPGPVVVHVPATRVLARLALLGLAAATGRTAALLWVDVPPGLALAGQRARGRMIKARSFVRHVRRARRTRRVMLAPTAPAGWRGVHVVTRADIAEGIHLIPLG
ncbi:AAA family ATPase [Actinopolyspora mortivallis]|uniref:AAA family ATPase n=1 Tax=Actinopolyspora mortivallis TaxID=33906 RepID=UPI00047ABB7A|nr:AAA family ATPase [Actinopolyspora mortivallis]